MCKNSAFRSQAAWVGASRQDMQLSAQIATGRKSIDSRAIGRGGIAARLVSVGATGDYYEPFRTMGNTLQGYPLEFALTQWGAR